MPKIYSLITPPNQALFQGGLTTLHTSVKKKKNISFYKRLRMKTPTPQKWIACPRKSTDDWSKALARTTS